ncbi:ABC transporter permease [Niveispirillum sp.]|uniref:ABC transporter permease n=1 Tax=Niveispirillum sp. TaxID=1917217 RepID=UPI001B6992A5|nr:ABC transporter permease [Niveispirillum sp.]MBP7334448.1 ABC transporter permease [Niveispirillum sp.]
MTRRGGFTPGFPLVFGREFARLRRRPFLLALTTLVPLALMALLTGIFSAGLATRLPIGVLDLDGSDLSRTIVRMVDATPDAAVSLRVGDLAEGRRLILSGRIHGLLMLPRDLERDVQAGRRPEVVFFYNAQTLTTGNLVLRGVAAAVQTAAAGIRLSLRTARGQPMDDAQSSLAPVPVPVQTHALFNPTLNYTHFLLAALLPALLQVTMMTGMAYAVGLDVETTHRLRILRRLGGGLWPAMAGKVLPYTLLFLLVLGLADAVLFGLLGLPLRGMPWLLLLADILFILACQMAGLLLALLLRPTAGAVSVASLLTGPAFGFMGIGFPRLAMGGFAQFWGALLPGTWFLMARIDQTVRGTPPELSWRPCLVLLGFVLALGLLSAARLEIMRRRTDAARAPRLPVTAEAVP